MLKLRHHFRFAGALAHFGELISRSPGTCRWFGLGMGHLSLPPQVTVDALRDLAANRHPVDGRTLVGSRRKRGGAPIPRFTEIVITMPPSIASLLDRSLDVASAHRHASAAAMSYLEIFAAGRVEGAGGSHKVISSNVVGIAFAGFTASVLRPLPRIRYLLLPFTYDEEEERWLALDATEIADECDEALRIYLSELCPDGEECGVEVTGDGAHGTGSNARDHLN